MKCSIPLPLAICHKYTIITNADENEIPIESKLILSNASA